MTSQTIWNRYVQERNPHDREQLLLMNLPLVRYVARRLSGALANGVELDDLVGAGTMGLMSAVESFEPERGLAFSTFAAPRIRGAILDDLRRRDPATRSLRQKERALARARESTGRAGGRAAGDREVASELGIEPERLWQWERETERTRPVSLDQPVGGQESGPQRSLRDVLPAQAEDGIEEAFERRELLELLQDAILELGERERVVLSLYYFEEMKLREIAEVLEVTESRVSQVRTKALGELRARLRHLRDAA